MRKVILIILDMVLILAVVTISCAAKQPISSPSPTIITTPTLTLNNTPAAQSSTTVSTIQHMVTVYTTQG